MPLIVMPEVEEFLRTTHMNTDTAGGTVLTCGLQGTGASSGDNSSENMTKGKWHTETPSSHWLWNNSPLDTYK
jgi:hypothetical protein